MNIDGFIETAWSKARELGEAASAIVVAFDGPAESDVAQEGGGRF